MMILDSNRSSTSFHSYDVLFLQSTAVEANIGSKSWTRVIVVDINRCLWSRIERFFRTWSFSNPVIQRVPPKPTEVRRIYDLRYVKILSCNCQVPCALKLRVEKWPIIGMYWQWFLTASGFPVCLNRNSPKASHFTLDRSVIPLRIGEHLKTVKGYTGRISFATLNCIALDWIYSALVSFGF